MLGHVGVLSKNQRPHRLVHHPRPPPPPAAAASFHETCECDDIHEALEGIQCIRFYQKVVMKNKPTRVVHEVRGGGIATGVHTLLGWAHIMA